MTAQYYKSAYESVFNSLPPWKKHAVKDDIQRNNWSGILIDFVKEVIFTAESAFDKSLSSERDNAKSTKPVVNNTRIVSPKINNISK